MTQRNYSWGIQSTSTTTLNETSRFVIPINEVLEAFAVIDVPFPEEDYEQFPEEGQITPAAHTGLKCDLNSFMATILIGGEITMNKLSTMYHAIDQTLQGKGVIDAEGCITVVQKLPDNYVLSELTREILTHVLDTLKIAYTQTIGFEGAVTIGTAALRAIEGIQTCMVIHLKTLNTTQENVKLYPTRQDMFHWLSNFPVYNFLIDNAVTLKLEDKIRLLYRASSLIVGNRVNPPEWVENGVNRIEYKLFNHKQSMSSEPILLKTTEFELEMPTTFSVTRIGLAQYTAKNALLFLLYDSLIHDDVLQNA